MSRSRARLAADWFAKLRQNAVTQEVEHTDVVDAEAEALEAKADAAAIGIIVGPIGPIGPIGPQGPTGATGATGPAGSTSYNAGTLGGLGLNTSTRNNQANKVVRTQGNGYAEFGWINTTSGATTTAATDYYVNTNDGYIRKKTLANVRKEIIGGAGAGSVGSYAFLRANSTSSSLNPGNVVGGSTMRYSSVNYDKSGTPAGTWRCMGYTINRNFPTVYLRIS